MSVSGPEISETFSFGAAPGNLFNEGGCVGCRAHRGCRPNDGGRCDGDGRLVPKIGIPGGATRSWDEGGAMTPHRC